MLHPSKQEEQPGEAIPSAREGPSLSLESCGATGRELSLSRPRQGGEVRGNKQSWKPGVQTGTSKRSNQSQVSR